VGNITWLHLSDFHFRASKLDSWNADIVLKSLLVDIEQCIKDENMSLDMVLITGDIAFSGSVKDYVLAENFLDNLLKITKLPKSKLFIVPGNHDIDRDKVTDGAGYIISAIDSNDKMYKICSGLEDVKLVLSKFNNFNDFIRKYFGKKRSIFDSRFHYIHKVNISGKKVALLGLNSAWSAFGGDIDRGKLILGELQIRKALEESQDADIRIAIFHHPFDWSAIPAGAVTT